MHSAAFLANRQTQPHRSSLMTIDQQTLKALEQEHTADKSLGEEQPKTYIGIFLSERACTSGELHRQKATLHLP